MVWIIDVRSTWRAETVVNRFFVIKTYLKLYKASSHIANEVCRGFRNVPVFLCGSPSILCYLIHAASFKPVPRTMMTKLLTIYCINSLRPRRNRPHFADDIFKCIFLNENVWIPIKFSLKFVPEGPINNISALVQIMAWRRPGDKPLSELMMVSLLMHICVTRPQWANVFSTLLVSVICHVYETLQ